MTKINLMKEQPEEYQFYSVNAEGKLIHAGVHRMYAPTLGTVLQYELQWQNWARRKWGKKFNRPEGRDIAVHIGVRKIGETESKLRWFRVSEKIFAGGSDALI